MAGFNWPAEEGFYSVRIFLVIQVMPADPVTPADAVARLAEILAPRQEFTEDEVCDALKAEGLPDTLAGRAYQFAQVAWGRAFLAGMDTQYSPDYLCFNAAGDVVESGRLAEEPCYATAARLAQGYAGCPGFERLALMSADVKAVNDALHAGSKPNNLVMGPPFLFQEALTPAGMENVQRVMDQHFKSIRLSSRPQPGAAKADKPWWRFWR